MIFQYCVGMESNQYNPHAVGFENGDGIGVIFMPVIFIFNCRIKEGKSRNNNVKSTGR